MDLFVTTKCFEDFFKKNFKKYVFPCFLGYLSPIVWGFGAKKRRVCQKSQVVRPEGAEAPSQGQRPGCNASKSQAPCKGKSIDY